MLARGGAGEGRPKQGRDTAPRWLARLGVKCPDALSAASPNRQSSRGLSRLMSDVLVFVLLAAGWIALQTWILPRMGVPT
jgi:hypothetical protein